jgi:hypothetical protein
LERKPIPKGAAMTLKASHKGISAEYRFHARIKKWSKRFASKLARTIGKRKLHKELNQ